MNLDKAGWLIWIKGIKGPEVQKCTEIPTNNATSREYSMLAKYSLNSEDMAKSLDQLAEQYPCE